MTARRTVRAVLCACVIVLCILGWAASPASAHAELVRSVPAAGHPLTAMPSQLVLVYDEEISLEASAVRFAGRRLPLSVKPGNFRELLVRTAGLEPTAAGWTFTWQAVSADDGHVTTGTVTIPRRAAAPEKLSPSPPVQAVDQTPKQLLTLARFLGYLALSVFVGAMVFLAFLWPAGADDARSRALLTAAWVLGLGSSATAIGLQGAYATMQPLRAILRTKTYLDVLTTHVGVVLAGRLLLWLLAGVVLADLLQRGAVAVQARAWRVGAVALSVGLLRITGMTGHSAEIPNSFLGAAADLAHLAGVSLWVGGLVVLVVGLLPRRQADELGVVLPKYSRLAMVAVLTIAAAGSVLAWQLVGSFHALLHTSYGHLLVLKLSLLGTVLLAAGRSKAWVQQRLDVAVLMRADQATVRPFVYSVAAEAFLVLLVLAVTSTLVMSSPGS